MRFIASTAQKDLTRMLRDPAGLLAWALMPVILMTLLSLVFGRADVVPQGKLLLDDQDSSLISSVLAGAFQREPLSKMIVVEAVEFEKGKKRLNAGEASALLVIPKGFGQAFLRSEPVKLELWKNPAERIMPSLIEEALAIVLEGGFYLQSLMGPDLKKIADSGISDMEVSRISVQIAQWSRQFSVYLNPPLIELETRVTGKQAKSTPIHLLFFPGMLMLTMFGMAQSLSEDYWRERTLGTLRRALTTPQSVSAFLLGKVAGVAALFAVLAGAGILCGRYGLSAPLENMAMGVVWVALSAVGLYLMAGLLQVYASEQRMGVMLNGFAFFVLSMMGGTFFPFEMMPEWLATIGRLTPNGWAVSRFKQLVGGPVDWAWLAGGYLVVAAFLGITFGLLVHRVRRWAV